MAADGIKSSRSGAPVPLVQKQEFDGPSGANVQKVLVEPELGPSQEQRRVGAQPAAGIGRQAISDGKTVRAFGQRFVRAAPPIQEVGALETKLANLLGGLFANRGLLGDGARINDYRSEDAVRAAMAKPVTAGQPLGPLTIFRPGLGNTAPGPAQIARLAQHSGKVVIAFANPGSGAEQRLRPINEVDGVPLPPELHGKVFAIGSPANVMISFEQGSDLFLEQLDAMRRSPHLDGIELEKAGATVVAHSQGGLDATLTRRRLDDAGLGGVMGKLYTLATPFRGSPVSNEHMIGLLTELGEAAAGLQSMGAVNALDPDHTQKIIHDADQRHVNLSLVGQTESGKDGRGDLRRFFKVSDVAIEAAQSLASLFKGRDVRENDGLVTVASQRFGADVHVLAKSYDHAGIAEDPAVIDELLRRI